MAKQNFTSWVLYILISIIWGSSFYLMKESSKDLTGVQIGAIRIFAAGICFLPFAVFHFRTIPSNKMIPVILAGLLGNFLPAFLFAMAIRENGESSLASILNSLTPVFVVVIGVLFFKVKVERKKIIGVIIGFAGLLILTLAKNASTSLDIGLLYILVATVFYGITVNLVGHYLKGIDGLKIATVSLAIMALPAAIIMWHQNVFTMARYDPGVRDSIIIAAVLGLAGSAIATAFFYILIQKAGGLFASLVTYAIPVVAIIWALIDKENVTGIQILALGVILVGVYLANK